MATCFVVMGFNTKTDYRTGRELNLDATYRYVIKPTVEECGLECIRADEIQHSGVIDLPMYQRLLDADLVSSRISPLRIPMPCMNSVCGTPFVHAATDHHRRG